MRLRLAQSTIQPDTAATNTHTHTHKKNARTHTHMAHAQVTGLKGGYTQLVSEQKSRQKVVLKKPKNVLPFWRSGGRWLWLGLYVGVNTKPVANATVHEQTSARGACCGQYEPAGHCVQFVTRPPGLYVPAKQGWGSAVGSLHSWPGSARYFFWGGGRRGMEG